MATEQITETVFFSPSSIVAIFNAATVTKEEKKIIQVRGIFRKTGTTNYAGNYYNRLKDEASDSSITLITSALLHQQLEDNKTIEFNGFISRRVDKQGRIEINVNLIELLAQRTNTFSDEETRKIELINEKVAVGFRDLDAHIKNCLFNNGRIGITVIMGRSGIIDTDIQKAMGETVGLYSIQYKRVSLASIDEITGAIEEVDDGATDIVCLARGGGENLSIFDSPELCRSILGRKAVIASAIGHAQDVSLFEKLADKKFITPTHFGHYLKEIYNSTKEELEQSKAKLVLDITTQLESNYRKQIANLDQQIKASNELHEKALTDASRNQQEKEAIHLQKVKAMEEQVKILKEQQLQKDKLVEQANSIAQQYEHQASNNKSQSILWLLIALAIGLVMGYLLFGRK